MRKGTKICPACGTDFVVWDGERWIWDICTDCPFRNPPVIATHDLENLHNIDNTHLSQHGAEQFERLNDQTDITSGKVGA